jgi:hypothetical protein
MRDAEWCTPLRRQSSHQRGKAAMGSSQRALVRQVTTMELVSKVRFLCFLCDS